MTVDVTLWRTHGGGILDVASLRAVLKHTVSLVFRGFAGIDEISVDAYKGVEHSDSEDSDKSDSSDSEYGSDVERKTKNNQDAAPASEAQEETTRKDQTSPNQDKDSKPEKGEAVGDASAASSDAPSKEKTSRDSEKENSEKAPVPPLSPGPREKSQGKDETSQPVPVEDSDSERELVIDLGDDQEGKDKKRSRKDNSAAKESSSGKPEGIIVLFPFHPKIKNPMWNTPPNLNSCYWTTSFCKLRGNNVYFCVLRKRPDCSRSHVSKCFSSLHEQQRLLTVPCAHSCHHGLLHCFLPCND